MADEDDKQKFDAQIADLEQKIAVERKMKLGAELMKPQLKDKNALSQVEIRINDSQRRLDFLEGELQKLRAKRTGGMDSSASGFSVDTTAASPQPGAGEKKSMAKVFAKASSGLLHKIVGLGGGSGVKDSLSGGDSGGSSYNSSDTQLQSSGGQLNGGFSSTIGTIGGIRQGSSAGLSLPHQSSASSSRKSSITNFEMIKSGTAMSAEKIAIRLAQLETKYEYELITKTGLENSLNVYAGSDRDKEKVDCERRLNVCNNKLALLLTALRHYRSMFVEGLADLSEMDKEVSKRPVSGRLKLTIVSAKNLVGKKSAKNEAFCIVRMDNVFLHGTKTRGKLSWNEVVDIRMDKNLELELSIYDKADGLLAIQYFKLGELEAEVAELTARLGSDLREGIESVYDLEPHGQVRLRFKFSSKNVLKEQNSRLQRNINVKRRKQHVINGHKFVTAQFYQVMKCALCGDYLMTGFGYQCEACSFLCHKKCFDKVLTKCLASTTDAAELAEEQQKQQALLRHNVHHRFEMVASVVPTWCCHCGYMLPLGTKKTFERCAECNINTHVGCRVHVPDFCGMSMETLNKLLAQALEIERLRKLKGPTSKAPSIRPVSTETLSAPTSKRSSATSLQPPVNKQLDQLVKPISQQLKVSLDDFHFVAVLGKGNFGKVMLAEDKLSKRLYAIKVLKKEFILQNDEIESTRSEKRVFVTINQNRNPFLVTLHSCFQTDTRIYFVMDYISGGDLMLHIQREQFSEWRAKFYACEVLLALECFHQNGIVYRDLKLDNILLTLDGHVKIADYGLCKENMGQGRTTNTFCGTPEFMAPEILLEQEYSRAVDWWAFGVLIYEMLLGQAPFKGQDEEEIFDAIINEQPQFPGDLAQDAVSIMQLLLEKDPAKRLGSTEADSAEIKAHPFFRSINWDDIYNLRIKPPFVPHISHTKDVSNFDEEFTKELPVLTPLQNDLHEQDQEEFRNFTYTADWILEAQQQQQQQKTVTLMSNLRQEPATSLSLLTLTDGGDAVTVQQQSNSQAHQVSTESPSPSSPTIVSPKPQLPPHLRAAAHMRQPLDALEREDSPDEANDETIIDSKNSSQSSDSSPESVSPIASENDDI